MSFWSGPPPPHPPPPLETHFGRLREVGGGWGGVKNVKQLTPTPSFWVKSHESFGFFQF